MTYYEHALNNKLGRNLQQEKQQAIALEAGNVIAYEYIDTYTQEWRWRLATALHVISRCVELEPWQSLSIRTVVEQNDIDAFGASGGNPLTSGRGRASEGGLAAAAVDTACVSVATRSNKATDGGDDGDGEDDGDDLFNQTVSHARSMMPTASPKTEQGRRLAKELAAKRTSFETRIDDVKTHMRMIKQRQAEAIQEERDAELAIEKAAKDLETARLKVRSIDPKYLREIQTYRTPPPVVQFVMSAVMFLMGLNGSTWHDTAALIRQPSFLSSVASFEPSQLDATKRQKLRERYLDDPSFSYEDAIRGSFAIGELYNWLIKQVEMDTATTQLHTFRDGRGNHAQEMAELRNQLEAAAQELEDLEDDMEALAEHYALVEGESDDAFTSDPQNGDSIVSRTARQGAFLSEDGAGLAGDLAGSYRLREHSDAYAGGMRSAMRPWTRPPHSPYSTSITILQSSVLCVVTAISPPKGTTQKLTEEQRRTIEEALTSRQKEAAQQQQKQRESDERSKLMDAAVAEALEAERKKVLAAQQQQQRRESDERSKLMDAAVAEALEAERKKVLAAQQQQQQRESDERSKLMDAAVAEALEAERKKVLAAQQQQQQRESDERSKLMDAAVAEALEAERKKVLAAQQQQQQQGCADADARGVTARSVEEAFDNSEALDGEVPNRVTRSLVLSSHAVSVVAGSPQKSVGLITSRHSKVFEGDEWDLVVEDSPEELKRAFIDDVAYICRVLNRAISNVAYVVGSLHVSFSVEHDALCSREDLQALVEDGDYPSMRALYDSRHEKRHQVRAAEMKEAARQEELAELTALAAQARVAKEEAWVEAARAKERLAKQRGEVVLHMAVAQTSSQNEALDELREQLAVKEVMQDATQLKLALEEANAQIDLLRNRMRGQSIQRACRGDDVVGSSGNEQGVHARGAAAAAATPAASAAASRSLKIDSAEEAACEQDVEDEKEQQQQQHSTALMTLQGELQNVKRALQVTQSELAVRATMQESMEQAVREAEARAVEESTKLREALADAETALKDAQWISAKALNEQADRALEKQERLRTEYEVQLLREKCRAQELEAAQEAVQATLAGVQTKYEAAQHQVAQLTQQNQRQEEEATAAASKQARMVVNRYVKDFEGDGWDMVLQDSPKELHAAFVSGAAEACGVLNTAVTNVQFRLGSLHASFDVAQLSTCDTKATQAAVHAAEFCDVHNLHKKRHACHASIEAAAAEAEAATRMVKQIAALKQALETSKDDVRKQIAELEKVHMARQREAVARVQAERAALEKQKSEAESKLAKVSSQLASVKEENQQLHSVVNAQKAGEARQKQLQRQCEVLDEAAADSLQVQTRAIDFAVNYCEHERKALQERVAEQGKGSLKMERAQIREMRLAIARISALSHPSSDVNEGDRASSVAVTLAQVDAEKAKLVSDLAGLMRSLDRAKQASDKAAQHLHRKLEQMDANIIDASNKAAAAQQRCLDFRVDNADLLEEKKEEGAAAAAADRDFAQRAKERARCAAALQQELEHKKAAWMESRQVLQEAYESPSAEAAQLMEELKDVFAVGGGGNGGDAPRAMARGLLPPARMTRGIISRTRPLSPRGSSSDAGTDADQVETGQDTAATQTRSCGGITDAWVAQLYEDAARAAARRDAIWMNLCLLSVVVCGLVSMRYRQYSV